MTSTSQESKVEVKTGASPEQAAATDTAKTVPLGEHIELRQRFRALEEENAKLKVPAENKSAAPAAAFDQEQIAALTRRARIQDLQVELNASPKQAEAVAAVMDKAKDLSPVEARQLAAMRQPDLFKDDDDGFQPGTHGVARPGVRMPEPVAERDEVGDSITYMRSLLDDKSPTFNKNKAGLYLNNLAGRLAAMDTGKPGHQLLPIQHKK